MKTGMHNTLNPYYILCSGSRASARSALTQRSSLHSSRYSQFAMLFEPHFSKVVNDAEESVNHDAYEEQSHTRRPLITLLNDSKMVVRNIPAVVRVTYIIAASDPENFFYNSYFFNICHIARKLNYLKASIMQKKLS
ncbi:hypothetical protein J6590_066777 [Homalodisca vitripennis]|nr:hypothetical protein J6590_066777 [Homalodisca vitripennis]